MVSIHWLDLLSFLFNVTNIKKPKLLNLSKNGNSYDNSNVSLEIDNKFTGEIFCSYTSPLINKKIFIFENGIVEQDDNIIRIKGPALNFDKRKLLITPKIIKSFRLNEKKDYLSSLEKSVNYFLSTVSKKNFFSPLSR